MHHLSHRVNLRTMAVASREDGVGCHGLAEPVGCTHMCRHMCRRYSDDLCMQQVGGTRKENMVWALVLWDFSDAT